MLRARYNQPFVLHKKQNPTLSLGVSVWQSIAVLFPCLSETSGVDLAQTGRSQDLQ